VNRNRRNGPRSARPGLAPSGMCCWHRRYRVTTMSRLYPCGHPRRCCRPLRCCHPPRCPRQLHCCHPFPKSFGCRPHQQPIDYPWFRSKPSRVPGRINSILRSAFSQFFQQGSAAAQCTRSEPERPWGRYSGPICVTPKCEFGIRRRLIGRFSKTTRRSSSTQNECKNVCLCSRSAVLESLARCVSVLIATLSARESQRVTFASNSHAPTSSRQQFVLPFGIFQQKLSFGGTIRGCEAILLNLARRERRPPGTQVLLPSSCSGPQPSQGAAFRQH
jgi:hypothetical protein